MDDERGIHDMDAEVTARLRAPIPGQLIKQLNGRDYISGQTAIDRLIQATDNDWSFRITNVIHGDGHVAMQGELTIHGTTRTAWGEAKSTSNPSEELFKNAETDTIKRCARLFGVALELYGDLLDEETGEVTRPATRQGRSRPAPPQGHEVPDVPQQRAVRGPQPDRYAQAAANDAERERDPNSATPNQIKAIFGIGKGRGMNPDTVKEWVGDNYGKHIDELTKAEASQIIESWQADTVPA